MLRIVLALLALCLTTPAFAQGVVGEWTVDVDALLKSPEIAKLPPAQRQQAIKMTQTMLAQMRMVVKADGTVSMNLNPTTSRAGTYKDLGGGKYEISVDGKPATATLKGDVIELMAGKTPMRFLRAKGAAAPTASQPVAKVASGPPIDFMGTWTVDIPATMASVADPKLRTKLERDAKRLTGMQLTFKDGKMTMKMGEKTRSGTYTHRATVAGVTTLDTVEDGRKRGEVFTLERKGAKLHVTADNDTLVFSR